MIDEKPIGTGSIPEFDISTLSDDHLITTAPRKWIETELSLWKDFKHLVHRASPSPSFTGDILARYENVFKAYEELYRGLQTASDPILAQSLWKHLAESNIVALRGQLGAKLKQLFHSAPIPVLHILEANTLSHLLATPNETERANRSAELQLNASKTLDSLPRALGQQSYYLIDIGRQYDAILTRIKASESAALKQNQINSKQLTDWIAAQRAEIEALHQIYHTRLGLEAPASFWESKANAANVSSRKFYNLFLALVAFGLVVTILAGWQLWPELKSLTQSTSLFPFSLIATLSVPVLGYAWVLKQVSRLFLTNRAIADDASYRHVMTMTYLGLVKDPNSGISKQERGLILNALFRPAPASTQDDGPPMGVFDLINGKKL